MKPKLWDGPNPVGEARARFNETIDTPYQTALGPGFSARKMNGFSEVTGESSSEEGTLPAFYSMGRIGVVNNLSGSDNAKTFRRLGKVYSNDFSIPNINYIGGQKGVVPRWEGGDQWSFLTTVDGRRFSPAVSFYTYGNEANGMLWLLVPGAQYGNRRGSLTWGIMLNYANPYMYSAYMYYKGDTKSWHQGATLTHPGFDCGAMISRVGPTKLVSFTAVMRMEPEDKDDDGNLIKANPGEAPWPFISVSNDNGATWAFVQMDSAFEDFADETRAVSFNAAMSRIAGEFYCAPKDPNTTVCVSEFLKHTEYDEKGFEQDPIWEYRVYHLTGSSLAKVTTLDRSRVRPDRGFIGSEVQSINRKVLIFDWVPFDIDPAFNEHIVCISHDWGATWTYRAKPWPKHHCGFLTWLDEDTLLCCVYDGEHSLYETKDLGVTWEKRATIRTEGDTPSTFAAYLRDFSILRQLRDERGEAAPVTPGAEWVTDPSVPYEPPSS